jgi:hypothetical protein
MTWLEAMKIVLEAKDEEEGVVDERTPWFSED